MKMTKKVNRTIVHETPKKCREEGHHFISEGLRGELGSHFAPKREIEEHIREKAYEIYEGRGYLPGGDMTDWMEAEKIVLGQQEQ